MDIEEKKEATDSVPLDTGIAPPPIEERRVRASNRLDINPPSLIAGLAALILVGCGAALRLHPAWVAKPKNGILSLFSPSNADRPGHLAIIEDGPGLTRRPMPQKPGPPQVRQTPRPLENLTERAQQRLDAAHGEEVLRRQFVTQKLNEEAGLRASAEARANSEEAARRNAEAAAESERLARQRADQLLQEHEAARLKAEADATKLAANAPIRVPITPEKTLHATAYSGPRFGTISWSGEVHGTELITIENGSASSGSVTGRLPGVPVLVQPVNTKKVGIASPPAPANDYKSMVIRVSGNGLMQLSFQWTLP